MTSHKTLYEEFCRAQSVPIHLQPWWLDAVCAEGTWDLCLSMGPEGGVTGALPYYRTRRWGLPVIQQPPCSTYGGPWLRYPENTGGKPSHRLHFEKKIYTDLIRQLPKVALFRQNFRPEVDNWLPFYWKGFRQTTRYTYILDAAAVQNADALLQSTTRNKIKQSADRFQVSVSEDFDAYFMLLQHSYRRKARPLPMSYASMKSLHVTLCLRDSCTLLLARSRSSGEPVAACYLIRDTQCAGLLGIGQLTGPQMAQINYRMMWECIQYCAAGGLGFDFEGSMDPGMEHVMRAFGGRLRPYSQVWKAGNALLETAWNFRR